MFYIYRVTVIFSVLAVGTIKTFGEANTNARAVDLKIVRALQNMSGKAESTCPSPRMMKSTTTSSTTVTRTVSDETDQEEEMEKS